MRRSTNASFWDLAFRKGKLSLVGSAFEDFKHRIRELTGRSWGVSMRYRFDKLAQLRARLDGLLRHLRVLPTGSGTGRVAAPTGAHVLLETVAMDVARKVRNLLALGTGKRAAILTAISSKSYWHLSRSLATQTGMTNDWLQHTGLGEYSCAVDEGARLRLRCSACSLSVNRPVRTRMPGGVGGAVSDSPRPDWASVFRIAFVGGRRTL